MERFLHQGTTRIWTIKTGQGLPFLLCNGGPGCDDYLAPIAALIEDSCEVIRFEPRGCGRSTYDGQYSLSQTIADIEAIRQFYNVDHMIIGGHSAGPDIALAYSLAYPQHVLGIIGIAGGRIVNDREWSTTYKANLAQFGESNGGKVFVADPAVNKMGNATWRQYIKRPHLLRDIAALTVPAIFINASEDIRPNWPTRQLAALIPHGRYVEIEGAAHSIWLTHADALGESMKRAVEEIVFFHQNKKSQH